MPRSTTPPTASASAPTPATSSRVSRWTSAGSAASRRPTTPGPRARRSPWKKPARSGGCSPFARFTRMAEPKVFTTAEWGARSVSSQFPKKPAQGIVLHHAVFPNRAPQQGNAEREAAFGVARRIQADHMGRGYADTGQQFTISRGGLLLEGRHGSLAAAKTGKVVRGAHAGVSL